MVRNEYLGQDLDFRSNKIKRLYISNISLEKVAYYYICKLYFIKAF